MAEPYFIGITEGGNDDEPEGPYKDHNQNAHEQHIDDIKNFVIVRLFHFYMFFFHLDFLLS